MALTAIHLYFGFHVEPPYITPAISTSLQRPFSSYRILPRSHQYAVKIYPLQQPPPLLIAQSNQTTLTNVPREHRAGRCLCTQSCGGSGLEVTGKRQHGESCKDRRVIYNVPLDGSAWEPPAWVMRLGVSVLGLMFWGLDWTKAFCIAMLQFTRPRLVRAYWYAMHDHIPASRWVLGIWQDGGPVAEARIVGRFWGATVVICGMKRGEDKV